MKQLLLVGLLAVGVTACSAPAADPGRAAVATYVKRHANDPASYESARWGKPKPFTRRDSATAAADRLFTAYKASQGSGNPSGNLSLIKESIRLAAVTDTARVGILLPHAYRAKNKLGATVLDSAQFVVYSSGQVQQL